MKRVIVLAVALGAGFAGAGCAAPDGGNAGAPRTSGEAWRDPPAIRDERLPPPGAPAVDRRIVLHTPPIYSRQRQESSRPITMVLVNQGHSGRRTVEGRTAIALGDATFGYKVLREDEMEALIKSLENHGVLSAGEAPGPEDLAYFTGGFDTSERFKGAILVEDAGRAVQVLGWQPGDDPRGRQRYQAFVDGKGLLMHWFNQGQVERPRQQADADDAGGR